MKKVLLSVVAVAIVACSSAYAAEGVKKDITIVANINDAIFVSKPDGSTWYDKEELFPRDYTQKEFSSNDLQVRVYTTAQKFNVSLVQPLTIARADGAEFQNVKVNFAGKEIIQGTPLELQQTSTVTGGYDNTYTLKINAEAPIIAAPGNTNGQYQGELVMLFEPTVDDEPEPEIEP